MVYDASSGRDRGQTSDVALDVDERIDPVHLCAFLRRHAEINQLQEKTPNLVLRP